MLKSAARCEFASTSFLYLPRPGPASFNQMLLIDRSKGEGNCHPPADHPPQLSACDQTRIEVVSSATSTGSKPELSKKTVVIVTAMTWLDALDSTKGVALEAPESTHLLRPFTIAAALLGQVSLSKNVAAEVATLLEIPELEESLI
jgi:hypothetical protein